MGVKFIQQMAFQGISADYSGWFRQTFFRPPPADSRKLFNDAIFLEAIIRIIRSDWDQRQGKRFSGYSLVESDFWLWILLNFDV